MTHSLPCFQNMSVVCKTEPDETEILPDPACGGIQIKKEENDFLVKDEENGIVVKKEEEELMDFVVKEEDEEQKVFKAENVDDAVLPGECRSCDHHRANREK